MKTFQLTGVRSMEPCEAPDPELRHATDVLIRMGAVGVCGSDIHYFEDGRIGSQVVKYPFTIGHEGAGIVEQVGSAVTRLRPGDRVAIDPAASCGRCDQCLSGRPNTCRDMTFLGCPGLAVGCLSELLVTPEDCCFPLAAPLTLEDGALSEPLSIGIYAARESISLRGARIGILGCGPIGMSVLLPACAAGAERIYVTDKLDARLDFARRAGATWTGNPLRDDIPSAIAECEPLLLDAVFECCGEQDAIDTALRLLKPGGKLMIIGIPRTDRLSFDMDLMRRRELTVRNIRRQAHCVEAALDLIRTAPAPARAMITHRFPFEETVAAFELVAGYRDGVMKAMILF